MENEKRVCRKCGHTNEVTPEDETAGVVRCQGCRLWLYLVLPGKDITGD